MTICHIDLWPHNILLDKNTFKENSLILFRRSIAKLSVSFFLQNTTKVLPQLCMIPIKKILSKKKTLERTFFIDIQI